MLDSVSLPVRGDACSHMIQSIELAFSPASAINLMAPGTFAIRDVAWRFGDIMGEGPVLAGTESGFHISTKPPKPIRFSESLRLPTKYTTDRKYDARRPGFSGVSCLPRSSEGVYKSASEERWVEIER